jgi:hypothetical protein
VEPYQLGLPAGDPLAVASRDSGAKKRDRILSRVAGLVVLGLIAGVGIGWSITVVFAPARDVPASAPWAYTTIHRGSVGSALDLDVVASWPSSPLPPNQASGTITTLNFTDGQTVQDGAVLYTVDEQPVVIAVGAVPDFEAIGSQTSGADVAQLQQLLLAEGLYKGKTDGKSSPGFAVAIRHWQQLIGASPTGTVSDGSIVFVPVLPMRIGINSSLLAVGLDIAPGAKLLSMVAAEPRFSLTVSSDQASEIADHAAITIRDGDARWLAGAGAQTSSQDGDVDIAIEPKDAGPICSTACGQIPVEGTTRLALTVVTNPTKTGLVVPSAAIFTSADGQTLVIARDGKRFRVRIDGNANGVSVISGAPAGLVVRFPNANGG